MAGIRTAVVFSALLTLLSTKATLGGDGSAVIDTSEENNSPQVVEDVSWPGFTYLRSVSGLAVDQEGHLYILHRGDREWNAHTFDGGYRLMDTERGPIPNDTVLVIDTTNGKIIRSWGANRFYLPHGLTVDHEGNTWITDVGLHQVFMFPSLESSPDLMLGDPFIPGAGKHHFCQPTDTAILPSGDFFVSDGYCNSRILMFTRSGQLIKEIGTRDGMVVPHSLTLVPKHDALCVADRENRRVLCYATGEDGTEPGTPLAKIENPGVGRVFAIDTRGDQLFLVNGPDLWANTPSVSANHGMVLNIENGLPRTLWGPDQGFHMPHDLAVSPDGHFAYVCEIDSSAPKRVYKFNIFD